MIPFLYPLTIPGLHLKATRDYFKCNRWYIERIDWVVYKYISTDSLTKGPSRSSQ